MLVVMLVREFIFCFRNTFLEKRFFLSVLLKQAYPHKKKITFFGFVCVDGKMIRGTVIPYGREAPTTKAQD